MRQIDYNEIEDYCLGRMKSSEIDKFESDLSNSEELKSALLWYEDIQFVAKHYEDLKLQNVLDYIELELEDEGFYKSFFTENESSFSDLLTDVGIANRIENIENDLVEESYYDNIAEAKDEKTIKSLPLKKKNNIISMRWMQLAAGVLFMIAAVWFIFTRNNTSNTYSFKDFSVEEQIESLESISPKPRSVDKNMSLLFILKQMNKKTTDSNIEGLFLNHFEQFKNDNRAFLYYGIYLLENKQYKKAKEYLEKVNGSETKKNEKEWCLGLVHLKLNDNQKAKTYFDSIEEDSPFYELAKKIKY